MKVKLTETYNVLGKRHSANECPVALSLQLAFNDPSIVVLGGKSPNGKATYVAHFGDIWSPLPQEICDAIYAFDTYGFHISPQEFDLVI